MEYTRLGNTGLQVSRICLGMMSFGTPQWRDWVLDEEKSRPIIRRAWELGINFFDTADMYSLGVSEEVTGKVLKELAPRDELVIATKVYQRMKDAPNSVGLSRKHIMEGIDNSLRRLGTDYVDLYQIHRWDYNTPIEETMEALHDVVKAGKALYIGASSMFAWQFAQALYTADKHGWTRFVSMQNHYNLVYREEEREMIPLCEAESTGIIPWSPLARGLLSGNRSRSGEAKTIRAQTDQYASQYDNETEDNYDIVDAVVALANERGVKPVQIALAWLLHQPAVTAPIVGTTKIAQLDDLIPAVDIELSDEEIKRLEAPYRPRHIIGHA